MGRAYLLDEIKCEIDIAFDTFGKGEGFFVLIWSDNIYVLPFSEFLRSYKRERNNK